MGDSRQPSAATSRHGERLATLERQVQELELLLESDAEAKSTTAHTELASALTRSRVWTGVASFKNPLDATFTFDSVDNEEVAGTARFKSRDSKVFIEWNFAGRIERKNGKEILTVSLDGFVDSYIMKPSYGQVCTLTAFAGGLRGSITQDENTLGSLSLSPEGD